MYTESDIEQIVLNVLQQRAISNQYTLNPIPAHDHDGVGSMPVSYLNIQDRFAIITHTLYGASAATAANYSVFFTAPYAMRLLYITEVHTTAGTDGGAVTLNFEKLQNTEAPTVGVFLLATAFNLKGAANTVQTAPTTANPLVLTNTNPPILNFAVGDRMGMILTGTPTSLANVSTTAVFLLS